MNNLFRRCAIALGAFLLLPCLAGAADWPQWRGPTRDGFVKGEPWPDRISDGALKLAWRVDLAESYSTPIVSGKLVFVTETRGRKEEVVTAFDRATGKQVWQVAWPGSMSVPFFAASNGSWVRSTPACDGESLYVAGMRDVLVCLEAATGKERWRVDFVERFAAPLPAFGFVCSPLVTEAHVYVQAGASVVKLDKRDGSTIWRALPDDGGMWGSAFSSPVIATICGTPQVLVQTRTTLAGLDLEAGKVLWSKEIPAFRGMNILTPVVVGDRVFTSSYGGKAFAFDIEKAGEGFKASERWVAAVEAYMSTPVVIGGHLYLHLRNQRFTCMDLDTGKTRWTSKPYGKYWSLVAQGERILALDERGDLYLIRASTEKLDILDQAAISPDSPTWAHLVVCDREVYVRELKGLAAYRWQDPTVDNGAGKP